MSSASRALFDRKSAYAFNAWQFTREWTRCKSQHMDKRTGTAPALQRAPARHRRDRRTHMDGIKVALLLEHFLTCQYSLGVLASFQMSCEARSRQSARVSSSNGGRGTGLTADGLQGLQALLVRLVPEQRHQRLNERSCRHVARA